MIGKLLRGEEVSQLLGISKSFAYQLIRTGQIPSIKLGRSVRVREDDLTLFIERNIKGGSASINGFPIRNQGK